MGSWYVVAGMLVEKRRWLVRIQPYIGAVLVVFGVIPLALAVMRGFDAKKLESLAFGLFFVFGGVSMMHRGTLTRAGFFGFTVGSLAFAILVAMALA